jgi:hypothetical protein
MSCICLASHSPVMDFVREIGPEFEKYIGKKKCDEKEYEKIS